MIATTPNFSLAAKEKTYPSPSPVLRVSKSFSTSLLQTLGVILLCTLLLQLLAPWLARPAPQNHTWEKTFPLPTPHLEKATYDYDAVSGSSLYCNGDPVNGLDPDGRCVEGTKAGWANGNGSFAGTYDSSQASSPFAYGLGWTVGGALGDVNAMVARPLAYTAAGIAGTALFGLNAAVESTEEFLGGPGARGAIGFMAPLVAMEAQAAAVSEVAEETIPALRQAYETDVQDLNGVSLSVRAAGQDAEATARMIHAERNNLKLQYRELTPANLLEQIEQRNIEKYKNPLGPTIQDLRSQGKTWEQIIESASRPGGRDIRF